MKFFTRDSWIVASAPIVAPLAVIAILAVITRHEIINRTSGTQREHTSRTAMELLNEWNVSLAMPRIDDIITGREPIRPMEKSGGAYPIIGECSTVRFSWENGPVNVGLDRTGDGSELFIDRAVDGYKHLALRVPPTER